MTKPLHINVKGLALLMAMQLINNSTNCMLKYSPSTPPTPFLSRYNPLKVNTLGQPWQCSGLRVLQSPHSPQHSEQEFLGWRVFSSEVNIQDVEEMARGGSSRDCTTHLLFGDMPLMCHSCRHTCCLEWCSGCSLLAPSVIQSSCTSMRYLRGCTCMPQCGQQAKSCSCMVTTTTPTVTTHRCRTKHYDYFICYHHHGEEVLLANRAFAACCSIMTE